MLKIKIKPIWIFRTIAVSVLSIAAFLIISNYRIVKNDVNAQGTCVAVPKENKVIGLRWVGYWDSGGQYSTVECPPHEPVSDCKFLSYVQGWNSIPLFRTHDDKGRYDCLGNYHNGFCDASSEICSMYLAYYDCSN